LNITPKDPNSPWDLWWTGQDEWGSGVSDKCPPDYFEAFIVQDDDDSLPIGTEYFVSSILTGNILMSASLDSPLTLGELKQQIASDGSFRHSFYSLKLVSNNEIQYLKIYID
jgi:hypothetical protein